MKRSIVAVLVVAALALAATMVWSAVTRDREYRRLVESGDAAVAADQPFVAIEAYSGAIALKGDAMLAWLRRGETYRRHGDLRAAVRDLRMASLLDPTATRPLEQLGDVHYAQQRYANAADRYAAYVRLDDRSPRVLYKLALARYQDGQPGAAIPSLRQAIRLNDGFGEAYYLLGLCLRAQNQMNEAVWALQRAVRAAPGVPAPREALAEVFDSLNRQQDRLQQLRALAALDPRALDRAIAVALAEADAGRTDLAVLALGRAAARHPDETAVYSALASVWLRPAESRGDHAALSKVLEATRTILARGTPTPSDLLLHGRALVLAGRYDEALSVLREVTSHLPVDPLAFERLATAAERSGGVIEAREALIRYAALADDERERARAAARVAELSLQLKEPAVAAAWFDRALVTRPQDPGLLSSLAEAQLAAGDLDSARETVARAVASGVRTSSLARIEQALERPASVGGASAVPRKLPLDGTKPRI
jgi:tetratricopeptide (TPR) repeat protein